MPLKTAGPPRRRPAAFAALELSLYVQGQGHGQTGAARAPVCPPVTRPAIPPMPPADSVRSFRPGSTKGPQESKRRETTMATVDTQPRELAHRTNNGVDV